MGPDVVFLHVPDLREDIHGILWMHADMYEATCAKYVSYRLRRILTGPFALNDRERDDMHHLLNQLNNDLRRLVLHHSG